MNGPLIGADEIRGLLTELGARLDAKGFEARLFMVDGAAMALAYSRDRVTRDLDAVFEPKREIYAESGQTGRERRLPEDWLNDAVKGLLPPNSRLTEGSAGFSTPGLHVGIAAPEYLFAMKAIAARQETDGHDLKLLAGIIGINTLDEALDLVEKFYGAYRIRLRPSSCSRISWAGKGGGTTNTCPGYLQRLAGAGAAAQLQPSASW